MTCSIYTFIKLAVCQQDQSKMALDLQNYSFENSLRKKEILTLIKFKNIHCIYFIVYHFTKKSTGCIGVIRISYKSAVL